jgi:hypothetical protein
MIFLLELLDAAGAVDELLLAGEKGVALGADLDADLLFRGPRFKCAAAGADHCAFFVVRMNVFLHQASLLFELNIIAGFVNFRQGNRRDTQYPFPYFLLFFLSDNTPELFINCVVSSRKEFADGTEFKTRGTRSQIPENLGHVPEFGARLQIHDRER